MAAPEAFSRTILHVDMDAFFASVEQRDRPELRGKPVLVGRVHRGVVCAASYEARPSGARSAMPMAEALRRCPEAVVVAPRFAAYEAASRAIFAIFRRYTPLVEGLSLDEAFLDVTASQALFGPGIAIARAIQWAIADEVGLAASAGVAPCKFVAKLASDWRKPRGLFAVAETEVAAFLAPLAVGRMPGVGPKLADRLHGCGLATIGALQRACPQALLRQLGPQGPALQALARGIDGRPVVPDAPAKSVGSESTLDQDATDVETIGRELLGHALTVGARLLRADRSASGVAVKLKDAAFAVQIRQCHLPHPTRDPDVLAEAARGLLPRFAIQGRAFRLVGLSAFDLSDGPPPPRLFAAQKQAERTRLEDVRAAVAQRFGAHKLTRASLLGEDGAQDRGEPENLREKAGGPARRPVGDASRDAWRR